VHAQTVVVWHAYGESEAAGLADAARAWEAEHPGVHVDLVASPFGAYASRLRTAIPSGHGPDLFVDAHNRLSTYVTERLVEPFGALETSDLPASAIEALRYEGTLWGAPLSMKCLALYVWRGAPDDAPIVTLEQLEALASDAPVGTYPLAWELGSTYATEGLFAAYGTQMIDARGDFAAADPAGARALAHLARLQEHGVVPPEATTNLVRDLFRSHRVRAAISGPWLAPDLPASSDWSVQPLPEVEGAGGARMVPYSTIEAAMVPTQAHQPELARDLARYLAGREGSVRRALVGGHVVASIAAWRAPSLSGQRVLSAFRDAALAAQPTPTHPHMDLVFGPMDRAIQKVLRGDATPEVALAEAAHRFADETRAAPAPRDPTLGIVSSSSMLILMLGLALARLRDPSMRAALVRSMPAYAWIAHAFLAVFVLVVVPLLVGAATSLFAGNPDLHYVGVANYVDILTNRGGDLLGHGSFWAVLAVTVLWTVVNVAFHVGIGVGLALLLTRKTVKLRGLTRVLLVVPWAVPSYVTALAWRGMFHRQLGAINAILALLGVEPVSWFAHFSTAFTANVATNVWLGFPFMMVVTLGALTSIPKDLYEAADLDGATALQKLTRITLPMLAPALLPAVAMGAVWTFNMFNVVFLVSAGEPDGTTEILVSEAYRWAFTRGHQIGYAAAYSVLIFAILAGLTRMLPRERKREAA
jgi:arabinogalactan oligomer/maltooligosaccharide transport system permease protein